MVRKTYRSSQLPTLHDSEGDVVWNKVHVGKQIYITANLYIQKQDPQYQDKITAITQRLLSLRSRRNRVFLVGDVNIDAARHADSNQSEFLQECLSMTSITRLDLLGDLKTSPTHFPPQTAIVVLPSHIDALAVDG